MIRTGRVSHVLRTDQLTDAVQSSRFNQTSPRQRTPLFERRCYSIFVLFPCEFWAVIVSRSAFDYVLDSEWASPIMNRYKRQETTLHLVQIKYFHGNQL